MASSPSGGPNPTTSPPTPLAQGEAGQALLSAPQPLIVADAPIQHLLDSAQVEEVLRLSLGPADYLAELAPLLLVSRSPSARSTETTVLAS